MMVAETVTAYADAQNGPGGPGRSHLESWAAELGLSVGEAAEMALAPPARSEYKRQGVTFHAGWPCRLCPPGPPRRISSKLARALQRTWPVRVSGSGRPVVATFRPVVALVTGQLHRWEGWRWWSRPGGCTGSRASPDSAMSHGDAWHRRSPAAGHFALPRECRFRWRGQCDRWYERPHWVRNAGKRDHPAGLNRRRALPGGKTGRCR